MSKKIVIIGAGPIGCYTAQLLEVYKYEPLLIEEHSQVGRPLHCTGLVGHKLFEERRPLSLPVSSITNVINGAVVHYDNQHFFLERKKVAYVIDRERFDKDLSKGLNILRENKFLGLEKIGSGYLIQTDNAGPFNADIVIGADGANSLLRKILNSDNRIKVSKGIQLRLKTKLRHRDLVEVFLKKPSFFWIVPEREDVARVGTISDNPHKDLQNFLKTAKIKGKILEQFGGLISIGICDKTVKDNIALVGDAACQMKPLSYGGLYFGLKAADILTSCIKENCLDEYDTLWKKELASEIRIGLKIKNIYERLDNEELKRIFFLVKKEKSLIERMGDFENHSRLILEILKKPRLYPQISTLIQMLFKKIL
jgi:flavin-dependent dehydrogenase